MEKDKREYNIDILRILASFMILTVHDGFSVGIRHAVFGQEGVPMFFIISGYCAFLSINRYMNKNGKISLIKYYVSRVIRIVPMVYFVLIIDVIISLLNNQKTPAIRYFLFAQQIIPSSNYMLFNNRNYTWTLTLFMFFYLLVPALYKVCKNYRKTSIVAVISVICSPIVYKIIVLLLNNKNVDELQDFAYNFPLTRLYLFILGLLIYFLKKDKNNKTAYVCLVLIFTTIVLQMEYFRYALIDAAFVLCFASIDIKITTNKIKKLIRILSNASFPLYLVHGIVIGNMSKIQVINGANKFIEFIVYFIASVLIAVILSQCEIFIKRTINKKRVKS